MSEDTNKEDINAAIERLTQENAELNGMVLATGVILTQLLQAMTLRELNPWNSATRIVNNAQSAIEGFAANDSSPRAQAVKERALTAIKQFEDQLRSVLPT